MKPTPCRCGREPAFSEYAYDDDFRLICCLKSPLATGNSRAEAIADWNAARARQDADERKRGAQRLARMRKHAYRPGRVS